MDILWNGNAEFTVNISNDTYTVCVFISNVYSWQGFSVFINNGTLVGHFIVLRRLDVLILVPFRGCIYLLAGYG